MKLYDFKGTVISEPCYFRAENNGKHMLRLRIRENKQGRIKSKTCWNCVLYLTEREFIEKNIEKGDVIQFSDAMLKSRATKNRIYLNDNGTTKVKNVSAEGGVHTDSKGRKYKIDYLDNTSIVAREGKWRLFEKSYEIYQLIVNGFLKLPLEDADFKADTLSFELEDAVIEKIEDKIANKLLLLEFVRHKRKAFTKRGVVSFVEMEDDWGGKYKVMQIKVIGE